MRELVEHGLHEHAALGFELELAADHAVGLDPQPPELIAPLAIGASGDPRDVDAVASLPSDTSRGVSVQRSTLGDDGGQLCCEHRLVGVVAGFAEP